MTMGALSPRPILVRASPSSSPQAEVKPEKPSPGTAVNRLTISKSYVIPPRPKPGRKPSSDVPPNRRKAQNREAQRAFRERKSQAVKALEEELAKQKRQFEKQQLQMREQIASLQKQNNQLQERGSPPGQYSSAPSPGSPGALSAYSTYPMTLPMPVVMPMPSSPGALLPHTPLAFQASSPPAVISATAASPQSQTSPFGTPVTPSDVASLELLDHVLDQKLPVNSDSQKQAVSPQRRLSKPANKTSPEAPQSPGVVRTKPPVTQNPLDLVNTTWSQPAVPLRRRKMSLETDFTSKFVSTSPRPFTMPYPPTPRDRCGFCTDNTPCICAASAAREEGGGLALDVGTLGSPLSMSISVEPSTPKEEAVSPQTQVPQDQRSQQQQKSPQESECTGNPSNCTQCRQDPMLTLFCATVSTKKASVLPSTGTYIPAQAAYKTLSRHPSFSGADFGELVDTLVVRGSQVEVNSVAKVLRMLDTR